MLKEPLVNIIFKEPSGRIVWVLPITNALKLSSVGFLIRKAIEVQT